MPTIPATMIPCPSSAAIPLCKELRLDEKDVIRHYDVIGKNCPKYYVDNEDEWKAFRKAVKAELKQK